MKLGNKLTSLRLDMSRHQNIFTHFRHRMRTGQSPLTLKVIGGIVGITENEKFFPIAPDMSTLLHEFAAEYARL